MERISSVKITGTVKFFSLIRDGILGKPVIRCLKERHKKTKQMLNDFLLLLSFPVLSLVQGTKNSLGPTPEPVVQFKEESQR